MATEAGKKWKRVSGPDLDVNKKDREKKNKSVFESKGFKKMCEIAEFTPTKRQASKYRRKMGLVYKKGKNLL